MNSISFYGGETTGSVGKRDLNLVRRNNVQIQTPQPDTVNFKGEGGDNEQSFPGRGRCPEGGWGDNKPELQAWKNDAKGINFKGRDYDEGSSGSGIIGFLAAVAIGIGGLAYAHKSGAIGKIKNPKVQNFAEKISKPCHSLCSKIKNFGIDCYNKIMKIFKK